MKNLFAFAFAFTMMFILTTAAFAQSADQEKSKTDKAAIEANYLAGLDSDNFGLVTDCIFYLGKMKSQKAVEPLIKILNDKYIFTAVRLIAALSLLHIENPDGVAAVRVAAGYCDCEQVKTLCNYFHQIYLMGDNYQNLVTRLNIEKPSW